MSGRPISIIGFGDVAEWAYAPALQAAGCDVRSIVEIHQQRRELATLMFPDAHVTTDVEDANLAGTTALILTPVPMHEAHIRQLATRGCNVFTEKPAACTADGWSRAQLATTSTGSNVVSAPFNHVTWSANVVREELGKRTSPVHIAADLSRDGPAWSGSLPEHRRWFFGPTSDPLWDLGIYGINPLTSWLGAPSTIGGSRSMSSMDVSIVDGDTSHEETLWSPHTVATLLWDDGSSAEFACQYRFHSKSTMQLSFDDTRIEFDPWSYDSPVVINRGGRIETVPPPSGVPEKYAHALGECFQLFENDAALQTHHKHVGLTIATIEALAALPQSSDVPALDRVSGKRA